MVEEAGSRISEKYREMLLGILDLEKVTVEDIIIPRLKFLPSILKMTGQILQNNLNIVDSLGSPVILGI